MTSAQQLWKREYSSARYERWPNNVDPVQMAAFRLREKLRSISVLRPGQRILNIPSIGVTTSRRAVQSAAADWWAVAGKTCVAAYQPKGAASLAASYVNLANPGTYNAAPGTAPGLGASGWTFNGSDQYLTTGVIPQIGWTALLAYSNFAAGSDVALWGVYDGGSIRAFGVTGQAAAMRSFAGAPYDHTPRLNAGVHGIANKTVYRDGVADSPDITFEVDTIARQLFIGALSYTSGPIQYGAFTGIAFVVYSDTLSAGEMADKTAAMAAL